MSREVISVLKRRGRAAMAIWLALVMLTFGPMLAYASSGDELWVARQPFAGGQIDIALDGAGNVYTAGSSRAEGGTVSGYSVNKYDNGVLLWNRRHEVPDYNIHAYAIAVDAAGNAYVTGQGAGGITTVKYSPEGTLAWSATNGQGVFGNDIAVDGAGNVYVTGSRTQYGVGGGESDYVTIKYDNNGAERWVKTYNGPGNGNDEATGIGLDAAGNIYVAGNSGGVSGRQAYAIIKYMPDGKQKWVARYDTVSARTQTYADTLSVDADGNVAVTGGASQDNNWLTVLYDTRGHLQWASSYPGGDGQSVKMDSAGNVVVAGYVNGATNMATVKYDVNTGQQIWDSIFGITGIYTWGWKLALDAADNIYVAGGMDNQYINDTLTVKYNSAGVEQWHSSYDNGGSEFVDSIAVNSSGVYVAGASGSNPPGVGEAVVIKYEP